MADSEGGGGGGFSDAGLVIGVLALIFVVWVATGGPSKPIASGGFFLTSPRPISTGEATRTGADLSYTAPSIFPRTGARDRQYTRPSRDEDDTQVSGRSPYQGDVYFLSDSVRGAQRSNSRQEYLYIGVSDTARNEIPITDWKLVSTVTGKYATIPRGTEVPRSGSITAAKRLYLQPGDEAYITTGDSPIGASFRTNTCTGYFEQYQNFSPSLPLRCPYGHDELKDFTNITNTACRDFVRNIPRCEIETDIPSTLSSECRSFIRNDLQYNGCRKNHERDSNFLRDEWRIFLGETGNFWRDTHDTIQLLDSDGRLVDQLSY